MRKLSSVGVCLLIILASPLFGDGPLLAQNVPAPGSLKRVVILSRHGVRSPTPDPDTLKQWRSDPTPLWPDWQQAPGYLTKAGAELAEKMGEYYRNRYANLFVPGDCPDHVFIWADRDERTVITAQALASGLTNPENKTPQCRFAIYESAEQPDPIFHPTQSKGSTPKCRFNADKVREAVGDFNAKLCEQYSQQLNQEQGVLKCCASSLCDSTCSKQPDGRCGAAAPGCNLNNVPSCLQVSGDSTQASFQGRWGIGQSFAEILLLEYENGFEGSDLGFGKVTQEDDVLRILPLHTGAFNALQRANYVDWRQGANLLYHLTYAIVNGSDPGIGGEENKFIAYVGHDTNIANLAELLGLNWQVGTYPKNDIPPTSALIFELRDVQGALSVYASYAAQTLEGDGQRVNPVPLPTSIPISKCVNMSRDGSCPLGSFATLVKQALHFDENRDCITDWK